MYLNFTSDDKFGSFRDESIFGTERAWSDLALPDTVVVLQAGICDLERAVASFGGRRPFVLLRVDADGRSVVFPTTLALLVDNLAGEDHGSGGVDLLVSGLLSPGLNCLWLAWNWKETFGWQTCFFFGFKTCFSYFCYFYVLSDQMYNKPINPFPVFHCETNKCKFSAKNLFYISLRNLFSKTKIRKQDKRANKKFYLNFKKQFLQYLKKYVFLSLDLTGPIIKMINFFRRSAY